MDAKRLFIVGVRLMGVWFLTQGILYGFGSLNFHLGLVPLGPDANTPSAYLIGGVENILVAVGLIFASSPAGKLFFGPDRAKSRSRDEDEDGTYRSIDRDDPPSHY